MKQEIEVTTLWGGHVVDVIRLPKDSPIPGGPFETRVRTVEKRKFKAPSLLSSLEPFYTRVLGTVVVLEAALIVAMLMTPVALRDADEDLHKKSASFVALILKKPEPKKIEPVHKSGARHKGEEGVFGKPDKPKEDKAASVPGARIVQKDKREEDRKKVMEVIAAMGLKGGERAVSSIFGPGGLGVGINEKLGGLKGSRLGDAGGAGGMGTRKGGPGGGGKTLGIGGLGSDGRGPDSYDEGFGPKKKFTLRVPKVVTKGGLDKAEIARVVKRHMSRIKFCYEKELNKDPNLEGKVVLSWTIGGNGLVKTASLAQNTMRNKKVGSCIQRIIRQMRFPKPRGGGKVFVTYPFVFSPAG